MKCPKCQYFSFDSGERCRNCGYDFSLSQDLPADDLPIQDGNEPLGPLADLSLHDIPGLPLFTKGGGGDPDAPLVAPGGAPRAPLGVRRTTAAAPRAKGRRETGRVDVDPEPRLALDTAEMAVVPEPPAAVDPVPVRPDVEPAAASAGARLAGGLIDLLLVGGIDLGVLYCTLTLCDLTFADVLALPLTPLISFLVLLNGGYLSTFVAAGGQTIGKMAAGTRVVRADPGAPLSERVPFGQSMIRAGGYLLSALPLGLGFLPAFFGRERRALHDRLADTRVVKA
jgi:uncharacterized RDD family membrane protein YckC